jgi:ABC-2 type transport system permease protein
VTRIIDVWTAAVAIVTRDWVLFRSYGVRFVTELIGGLFALLLFYYLSQIVSSSAFATSGDYFAFAVVGLIVMQTLATTVTAVPIGVRQELVAGTLERLVLSPFGVVGAVTAMLAFPFLLSFVRGAVTLTISYVVFEMPVEWPTVPLAIPVALVGALAFAPFALLIAAAVLTVKQAGAGSGFVVSLIALTSGFFFPVALLPDWLEWASEVQPFTPTLNLLRNLLVGTPLEGSAWGALARVIAFALVLMPLAVWVLSASVQFAQRRGTITEY